MREEQQIGESQLPIYIIGAGGIVNDAHLPAYHLAGFDVKGIYDLDPGKAAATAHRFEIPFYGSLEEMIRDTGENCVVDIAVPGAALPQVLELLPDRANVLMQKPMGENYVAAKQILEIARRKKLNAGVNFQLRYAPFIEEVRTMLRTGALGKLVDIEINVNVFTPWHLWDFLFDAKRVEILYHSIHYIDLIRSFFGNPLSIYAKTIQHPSMQQLASVKTSVIMDYGSMIRSTILTNHCNVFGVEEQQSYIRFEGTKGVVRIDLGLLKDYPGGMEDRFRFTLLEDDTATGWREKVIAGSWFPHAFIGSMQQVMLAAAEVIEEPDNSVEDAIHTMACVEAAYESSVQGGVKPVIE